MKTSDFSAAGDLGGTEVAGVVQDEVTVKTTVEDISLIISGLPSVTIADEASTEGFSSIAIGLDSYAGGSTSSMAIGSGAASSAYLTLAIASPSYVTGAADVVVGNYSFATSGSAVTCGSGNEGTAPYATIMGRDNISGGRYAVAIGNNISIEGDARQTVLIGGNVGGLEAKNSVAVGSLVGVFGPYCVGIGTKSNAIYRGVSIGYHSGFQNVSFYGAGEASIAIGTNFYTPIGPTIGIGYESISVYNAVALGSKLTASTESVAVGYSNEVIGTRSVVVGQYLSSTASGTVLLGTGSTAYFDYAMVLGTEAYAPAIGGSFVSSGAQTSALLRPLVFHQKFIAGTTSPKKATAAWGNGSYLATVTYDTVGTSGNSLTLAVGNNIADAPLSTSFSDGTFSILLATNDPSTNTLLNISDLFPVDGFSFSYTSGFDSTVISFTFSEAFANGADGAPTKILTMDGSSPGYGNLPATFVNSLATLTGTVVACYPGFFEGGGDAANFTLAPVMVLQKHDSTYSFIGTPTFTLTSHTSGAADWDVPVLATSEDTTQLQITVNNTDSDLAWMAHLTFEASHDNS